MIPRRRVLRLGAALLGALGAAGLTGCAGPAASGAGASASAALAGSGAAPAWEGLAETGTLELAYAQRFSVTQYTGGYALITIPDSGRYLTVPEGAPVPEGLPEDVAPLLLPLTQIYLASTSAMDLFRAVDGVDAIRFAGLPENEWYIPEAQAALAAGDMVYAGKYNAPDYERMLAEGCDLAVENTMIYHTPEVKEQLEALGIPVLVERSSYEGHPLGRMEWVKLYGVLLGKEDLAAQVFAEKTAALEPILSQPSTGKTAAYFYITSAGTVSVRRPGDYLAVMIEMAGGVYLPADLEDESQGAQSTMTIDMETFYAAAKDADFLIYNSTIDGELETVAQLLDKSSLLAGFKAVQNGQVYCTGQNLFQETMGLGDMMLDLHTLFTEEAPQGMTYLYRLT